MPANNNLLLRIVSAIVLGLVVVSGVVWSNFLLNLVLVAGAIVAGGEWTYIVQPTTRVEGRNFRDPAKRALAVLPVALVVLWLIATRIPPERYPLELVLGSVLLVPLLFVMRVPLSPLMLCGFPYLGASILSLLALHRAQHWHALVFLLIMVWSTDTFAFVFGKLIGGRKLAPRISPGKTWSGSLGGLFAAIAVAACVAHWLGNGSIPLAMAVGGFISLLTQMGDLMESALKRRFGVKDSGWLIPGHGGILDRIDGLLLATPVFSAYLLWFGGNL